MIPIFLATLLFSTPPILPSQSIRINGKPHKIIWTFDDHPQLPVTIKFLDFLKQHRIKGTFFVNTYMLSFQRTKITEKYYKAYERIYQDGHMFGNHSHTHPNMCNLSMTALLYQLKTPQRLIHKLLGFYPTLWRYPHGVICRSVAKEVLRLKLKTVWWDVSDWKSDGYSMWQKVRHRVRRGKTQTIVLFHNKIRKLENFYWMLSRQQK